MLEQKLKKNKLSEIDFYFVSDSILSKKGIISDISNSLRAGCRIIQYREKDRSANEMLKEALEIKKLCKGNAILLVNDRIDVALAVDADGVHLGQNDMPIQIARRLLGKGKIIGLTAHNAKEAIEAEKQGADYIALSPIFATSTKKDAGKACGIEMIKKVRKATNIPLVAIGGINKQNVSRVVKAGADAVVAISAVVGSKDAYKEVCEFRKIICKSKQKI